MAAEIAASHRPTLSLDSRNMHVETGISQENLDPVLDEPQESSGSHSPFTFTPRPYLPLAPASSNAQHLDARPNSQHRKGHSRSHSRQPSIALPSFSFNPGAPTQSTSSTTFSTPPATPTEEFPSSPSKSGKHRRTTSEYIGGSGATGLDGIRSASPSKRESSVSAPSTPVRPNAPSRGHRHRRSGAVSSADLSNLAKQGLHGGPPHSRGSSFGSLNNAIAKSVGGGDESSPREPSKGSMHSASSPSRGRVGFSDTVEFIPRPLSTISSATESSLSTMRGHSKSGSVSSVASFGPGSPPGKGFTFGLPITLEEGVLRPRPKSAGAELHHRRHPSFPCDEDSSNIRRPMSASSVVRSDSFDESAAARNVRKSRKLGGWASSLLARHPKAVNEPKQTSTSLYVSEPPQPVVQPQLELLESPELNEDFDNDPTSTIETNRPIYSFSRPLSLHVDLAKSVSSRQPIDDRGSPLIDLDAAMSSGKPSSFQDIKGKGKSFSTARQSMHSSSVLSGFLGPGMHYHRRAESEPHLPFVEFNRSDVRYSHSSSAAYKGFEMENVFEEEQEDDLSGSLISEHVQQHNQSNDDDGLGVGIQVVELDDADHSPTEKPLPRLRSSRNPGRRRIEPPQQDFSLLRNAGGVEIVGEDGAIDETGTRSSDSTLTSLDRLDDDQEEKKVEILPLAIPQPPYMTPAASTESGYSTPSYGNSTFSTPRLDTSACSLVEPRKYPSFAFGGEHGPEHRQSVDGVPSLISSRSTTTSAINGQQAYSNSPSVTDLSQAVPGPGSMASLGSTTSRRRKRSSVASLSRIMGGTFGAKSNLSVEYNARCHTSYGAKETVELKEKRTRRLSKMFKFFKSRENVADT